MLDNEDEQVVAGDGVPSPLFQQTDDEMGKKNYFRPICS
jgi:hypothetical protein